MLAEVRPTKPLKTMTLGEFMDSDLEERPRHPATKLAYMGRVQVLKRLCGGVALADITVAESRRVHALILRAKNPRKPTQTYMRSTQVGLWRQYVMTIGFASELGLLNLDAHPWLPKLSKGDWPKERAPESKRQKYIELDQIDAFLAVAESECERLTRPDLLMMTRLCFDSGPRLGEVRAIAPWDFEPLSNTIVVDKTATGTESGWAVGSPKNDRIRRIQVSPEVGKAFRAYLRTLPGGCELAFPSPRTGGMHAPNNIRAYWTRWAKLAGIGHISPHTARHVSATNALQAGVNPKVVAEQMGHGINALDAYYSHIPADALREGQEMRTAWEASKRAKTEGQALEEHPALGSQDEVRIQDGSA